MYFIIQRALGQLVTVTVKLIILRQRKLYNYTSNIKNIFFIKFMTNSYNMPTGSLAMFLMKSSWMLGQLSLPSPERKNKLLVKQCGERSEGFAVVEQNCDLFKKSIYFSVLLNDIWSRYT